MLIWQGIMRSFEPALSPILCVSYKTFGFGIKVQNTFFYFVCMLVEKYINSISKLIVGLVKQPCASTLFVPTALL